jgi:hypothetical protein
VSFPLLNHFPFQPELPLEIYQLPPLWIQIFQVVKYFPVESSQNFAVHSPSEGAEFAPFINANPNNNAIIFIIGCHFHIFSKPLA